MSETASAPVEVAEVCIKFKNGEKYYIYLNGSSPGVEATRFAFNPSGLQSVNILKALASAFIDYCAKEQVSHKEAGREYAVAKTEIETACMWAVKGATTPRQGKELPDG